MLCMLVAVIPISGAVDDQNNNAIGENPADGLSIGVTNSEIQETQDVLQKNKPFGEKTTEILGNNTTDGSLKLGSTGDKVKELQKWLTDYSYYSGDIDGNFGADTEKAVKAFQEEAGLIVDGVVGKDTTKAMENWDKYVAEVQAAAGESDTSYSSKSSSSSKSSYSSSKKSYATAVRSYTKRSYSSYGGKGVGDCWDNSAALYGQLTSSGQRARIVQYASSWASNHRSVQTWNGNSWVDYDYKGNGYAMRYYATSGSSSGKVIASS
ncbi:MAG: peptidoglycan-binding protein [Methanobacterium sp.]|nr:MULTISPECIES: peptidoglycan-binding domain-containing protein [unclassified Methanobacterium]AUB58873.1 peptidoglycan-binding protein [Methanobacterium sp. MZ-A1]MBW4257562.1 peptidoglycan-binding protein [Methanobacterium sp. YSL]MCC7559357.1 peptidoglycan-binding protein [Methanobacterium sp.]